MKLLGDLNWRLPAATGLTYSLGGWGFRTILKRIATPLMVVLFSFLYFKLRKWWYIFLYLACGLAGFGTMTLPLTFIGDSLHTHWFNFIWVFIVGFLMTASLLPLCFLTDGDSTLKEDICKRLDRWLFGLAIGSISIGGSLLLSSTVGIPTHAIAEIIIGLSYGGVAGWIINRV